MAGPTIASAEVDVDFDGSGMTRQARRIAQQAGKAFSGEFSDEVNSHAESMLTPAGRRIARAMGDVGETSGRSFTDRLADSVQSSLSGFDDDLAAAIVSGDWGAAVRKFDGVDQAAEGLGKRMAELRKQGQLTEEQYNTIGASFERYRASLQGSQRELKETAAAQERQAAATRDADFAMKVYLDRVKNLVTAEKNRVAVAEKTARAMDRASRSTKSSNDEEGRSFSLLGRLSGARNDFLNIVGRTARLMEGLPRLFEGFGAGVQTVAANIGKATEGLSGFQKVAAVVRTGLSGLGQSLKGLVGKGGLIGAGVAVGLLAAALLSLGNMITGVASGLSALTGIITALASSLTAALGGALLSVGPMLGALTVGIAGVTIAVLNNQDAFKKAVGPLTTWTKEVGKVAGAALLPSVAKSASTLADVLSDRVTPMLEKSAGAVGKWAESFSNALNSGDMRRNLGVFETTWPGILRNLGDIFTNVFTGLSGILAAISPSVEKFTGLIADAAEKFSDWANSAGGKNTVRDFFEGAWESAKKLWDILTNVATAIGNVFSQGKDTGDSFLDSLVEITDQFAKWTDSDEGREAISTWFEDAKDLASTLGEFIGDIAEKFDEWDTDRNREDFNDMLDTVGSIVTGVMSIVTGLNAAADWLADMVDSANNLQDNLLGGIGDWFSGQFAEIGDIWGGLTSGLGEAWAAVSGWWSGTFVPFIQNLPAQVGELLSGLWSGLTGGLGEAWAAVQGWWTGTMLPFFQNLPVQIGQFITQVGQWFLRLPGMIITALLGLPALLGGLFASAFTTLGPIVGAGIQTVVTFVASLPGRILAALASLGGLLAGWARGAWNAAYSAVVSTVARIFSFVATIPGRIARGVASLGGLLAGWARNAWNAAYNAITGVVGRIISYVGGIPGRIVRGVGSLGGMLAGWARNAWNAAYNAITGVVGRIISYVAGIPGRIMGALGNLGSLLYSAGQNIVQGLYNGLTSAWGRVTSWASNAASGLASGVRKVLGIGSPSKVFAEIGKWTAEGFIVGFRKQAEQGRGAFKELSASTVNSLTDGLAKGSKEAGAETKRILAKVSDMQVQAIKSNQRALANTVTSARKSLSGIRETSTVKDLKRYYSAVNATVRDSGAALRATIKKNGTNLTNTLKQYETATAQLATARKKLDELRKASSQLRDSISSSIVGQLNLGSLVSDGGQKPTFDTVSGYVASMKAKAQTFATKMKALVKAGIPPALVQQIAGLGLDGAIDVANALLAGSPAQIKKLSSDFSAFTSAATSIGTTAANQMYGVGIAAQKGLINGLVADTGDLKKAAKTLTDRLTKYVKTNLGIKSPSRVFATIGEQLMAGLAGGIDSGARRAVGAASSVVSQLSGLGAGASIGSPSLRRGGGVFAGTTVTGPAGRSVVIEQGAIQVVTPLADPRLVASQMLDRLAVRAG